MGVCSRCHAARAELAAMTERAERAERRVEAFREELSVAKDGLALAERDILRAELAAMTATIPLLLRPLVAIERMRWRLTEDAAVELLNMIVKGPKTIEAEELIVRCVMPSLSGCPKCGACLGVNIDCDLCDAVISAWRSVRARLDADGEGIRLPGDRDEKIAAALKGEGE